MVNESKKEKKDEVRPDFNNPEEFGNWETLVHNRLKNSAGYNSILDYHIRLGFEPTLEGLMNHVDWNHHSVLDQQII